MGTTDAAVESGAVDDTALRTPRRRCYVTRRVADKGELIRFVVGPGGTVLADVAGTLPGRGLWLSADRAVVDTACAKTLFAKGFRSSVKVGDDLGDRIEAMLARRCLDFLGLARRAGNLVAGFEKVSSMVAAGQCGVLVVASDAGADGPRKLAGWSGVRWPLVNSFSAAELSAALGREHAVYVALKKGKMADRFAVEAARLAGFRQDDGVKLPAVPGEEGN